MALTGEDAQTARREAKQLQRQLDAASKLQGEQLQTELASLKQAGLSAHDWTLVSHTHSGSSRCWLQRNWCGLS